MYLEYILIEHCLLVKLAKYVQISQIYSVIQSVYLKKKKVTIR